MPRPNRPRTIASEANLARRIAFEREQRGLSYDGLAKLMTEAGCALQGSAIYRIEKGDPPRRVAVDELVALASVFELSTVDELLLPLELIQKEHARVLIEESDNIIAMLGETTGRLFEMCAEYFRLSLSSPDLAEFVHNHWDAAVADPADAVTAQQGADLTPRQQEIVAEAAKAKSSFINAIVELAGDYAAAEAAL